MPEAGAAAGDRRALGVLLTLGALVVLCAIPLRVVGHGWLPRDDVRRHAAKVVSGKEWPEILVLRPEARVDEHPGWHRLLGAARDLGAGTPRALAVVAIVVAGTAFLVAPLFAFARPEAWLAALAAVALFEPGFFHRVLSGRPFVLAMALLAVLAAAWRRFRAERTPWPACAALAAGFALVSWTHGGWYLWLVPIAAFFAARETRAATRIAACAGAGLVAGACLTGHPFTFLGQAVAHLFWSFGTGDLQGQLATEFQPGQPAAAWLLVVAGLLAWRRTRATGRPLADPVFLTALAGWTLGLAVSRFWTDWGLPALCVWLALGLEAELAALRRPAARALATLFAAAVLFLAVTGNRGERWSSLEGDRHLSLDDPAQRPWLPGPGGVLYSNSMGVFYDTFFENPRAPWRYLVGFEPGMMPPAELEVFRAVQRADASDAALRPWVAELRAADRLVVARPNRPPPQIPELDWYSPFAGVWIGRPHAGRAPAP